MLRFLIRRLCLRRSSTSSIASRFGNGSLRLPLFLGAASSLQDSTPAALKALTEAYSNRCCSRRQNKDAQQHAAIAHWCVGRCPLLPFCMQACERARFRCCIRGSSLAEWKSKPLCGFCAYPVFTDDMTRAVMRDVDVMS